MINHRSEDFTRRGERYDALFDVGGNRPLADCRRALTEKGILVAVGAPPGRWLAPATRLLEAAASSPFVSQRLVPFVSRNDAAGLVLLGELVEAGKIRPVIDRRYPLAEAAEAIRYVGEGHPQGKVVVQSAVGRIGEHETPGPSYTSFAGPQHVMDEKANDRNGAFRVGTRDDLVD